MPIKGVIIGLYDLFSEASDHLKESGPVATLSSKGSKKINHLQTIFGKWFFVITIIPI